jgi:hypothetical protein
MKNLLLVVAMVVLCLAVGMSASAEEFTENGFIYEVEDGNAIIVGCDSTVSGDVTIPSMLNGYTVTEIGEDAFKGNSVITSVIFPDSINLIGSYAFYRATNLVEIEIPDNILIDDSAFDECYRLKKIKFPEVVNNIEIGSGAFSLCYYLETLEIPDGVTIQEYAFQGCYGLKEVYISNNVGKIGEEAIIFTVFLEKIYVEGMTTEFGKNSLGASEFTCSGLSREEFLETMILGSTTEDEEKYLEIILNSLTYYDSLVHIGTIYCHAGSTAEKYAIENGVDYELTHFYEDEWTYDYENGIKYRKCIHCDVTETEALEPTTPEEPTIPDEPVTPDEPVVPDEPQEETKDDFFANIFDLIMMLLDLIASMFKK